MKLRSLKKSGYNIIAVAFLVLALSLLSITTSIIHRNSDKLSGLITSLVENRSEIDRIDQAILLYGELAEREKTLLIANSEFSEELETVLEILKSEEINQLEQRQSELGSIAVSMMTDLESKHKYSLILFLIQTAVILIILTLLYNNIQNLKKVKFEAADHVKRKNAMVVNLSHEMRTPLHSIYALTDELFSQKAKKGEECEIIDAIKLSSSRLISIVNNILDSAKMEAGKFKPKLFPFVPHAVIMEVILEFAIQAKRKNLTLTSRIDRSTDMKVYGDAFQFRQILINVISNAIKYTDRGVIYVSASLMTNDQVRSVLELSIEDTGRGISKDQLPYIFEEYNTQNDGWEIKEGSTGLGLYIVKKIIDSHKGEIKVSSELGKGSSFTIKLPYDIFPEMETIGSTNLPCRKILLVENDPLNLKILSLFLANENQMVTNSMDGEEAFSIYIRNHFDLVITDISLPGLNGFELASKIRELPDSKKSSVPIIAISGFEKHDKQQEHGCSDINAWLVKPFDTNLLLIKVQELCNKSLYRTNKLDEYN